MSFATAIGIDIEVYNSRRDFTRIAAAAFGPEEQMAVAREGASAFYRIWTLREAMAKASGAGIAEVADRTDRVGKSPKEGAWRQRVGTTYWWLAHGAPVSGLSFAVALLDAGNVRTVSPLFNALSAAVPLDPSSPIPRIPSDKTLARQRGDATKSAINAPA
jgi:hypothetical protein